MADLRINLGGTFDATVTPRKIRLGGSSEAGRRGSFWNKGASRIYVGLNIPNFTADESEEVGKVWADANQAIRLPRACTYVTVATASGSAKVNYLED